jgi:hypothetical protein
MQIRVIQLTLRTRQSYRLKRQILFSARKQPFGFSHDVIAEADYRVSFPGVPLIIRS